ncbi:MAG: DUF1501 domain-containing protein [Deltaproteobacteria bacterium]
MGPTGSRATFPYPLLRRDLLRIGSLGAVGLALPDLLRAEPRPTGAAASRPNPPRARSCILFFLEGGPAHQDLWDMKPQAPAEVRGEFQPIASTLAGVPICEHLPLLSRQMQRLALIRSVHHDIVDHNAGSYYALTGRSPVAGGKLIVADGPENFPPFGAVLSRLSPAAARLPEFVHLPDIMSNNGYDLPGERGGFLGPAYDPLVAGDPSSPGYTVPGLGLPAEIPALRLDRRRALLDSLDRSAAGLEGDAKWAGMQTHYARAFSLLAGDETRKAFDLSREPAAVRERYGLPDRVDRSVEARKFGGLPHLGQCMLLARRLIEAGVRLVTVCTGRRIDQSWDTHRQHFPLLKKSLLPYADRAFSALLEDLAERGLLDETLVVAMGEFGRTPKLGQITSGAGADAAGRDHWPHCYTVLMAGGGICPGMVYGASDAFAAYPKSNAVTPEDIAATIYHALGIPPETVIYDSLDRPHVVALGTPIGELFG